MTERILAIDPSIQSLHAAYAWGIREGCRVRVQEVGRLKFGGANVSERLMNLGVQVQVLMQRTNPRKVAVELADDWMQTKRNQRPMRKLYLATGVIMGAAKSEDPTRDVRGVSVRDWIGQRKHEDMLHDTRLTLAWPESRCLTDDEVMAGGLLLWFAETLGIEERSKA